MKTFRLVLSLAVLVGLSNAAFAYRITVLDPTNFPVTGITDTSQPINVTFAACQTGQLPTSAGSGAGYGCYSALNATGSTITTLELVFSKTGPFATGLDCTQDAALSADLLFSNVSCSVGTNDIAFFFSGRPGIAPTNGSFFTIVVQGVSAQDLPNIPAATLTTPPSIVTPAGAVTTPEPGSFALLSTGLASLGATAWKKRRSLGIRNS